MLRQGEVPGSVCSCFLLFACPFWAGLTAYDLLCGRYIWPSTYGVGTILGFAVAGVWSGVRDWKRSAKKEIGVAI